jgi:hypothetical protein
MKQLVFGGCHCGAVRFSCSLELATPTLRCNCSVCSKGRYWFAAVPAGDFELLAGENALADYRFGSHAVRHRFCHTCGIKTFGQGNLPAFGGPFFAVSVACLELAPEVLARLSVAFHDGATGSGQPPVVTSYL